nr:hypothetical protein B24H17.170 [imported] - Neurospora crassa [Neurospora crassa]
MPLATLYMEKYFVIHVYHGSSRFVTQNIGISSTTHSVAGSVISTSLSAVPFGAGLFVNFVSQTYMHWCVKAAIHLIRKPELGSSHRHGYHLYRTSVPLYTVLSLGMKPY